MRKDCKNFVAKCIKNYLSEYSVDEEINDKYNNFVTGIQRRSKIKMMNATLEDIQYYPDRELDRELIMKLSTCSYIDDHINVIVIGATGSGKHILFQHWEMPHARKQKL